MLIYFCRGDLIFQSTPSVGRTTDSKRDKHEESKISIHALRGEDDLSAVDYVTRIMEEYPHAILCTNTEFADYPFNAVVSPEPNGVMSVRDYFSHELITHEWICDRLAENSSYRVCVEYSGLDCLKWVNNGEYGVIFFIDEFHLELNSLESKNIDIDVMVEISQQRKQRKHIVGTSQVFMRLAKPLREQIKDIVDCHSLLNLFQWNYIIDGEKSTEKDGQLEPVIVGRSFFFHSPISIHALRGEDDSKNIQICNIVFVHSAYKIIYFCDSCAFYLT